jgi:LmbE family N-acetylglucosaminyl deacetylase
MELTVDGEHLGTPELQWQRSGRTQRLEPLRIGRPRRVVVVAPHPDDEVLGAGGLIRRLAEEGSDLEILAVSDGEASHLGAGTTLGAVRRAESVVALGRLGVRRARVTGLGLPDGRVTEHGEELRVALAHHLEGADLVLAPWSRDGHPDHDACGLATTAVAACTGTRTLAYLVWAWHWADPCSEDIPWRECRRFELDRTGMARKRWSIRAYRSQIRPFGSPHPTPPVLPRPVLKRLRRNFEVYVEGPSA